jgi:hypothetical protein
MAFKKNESSVHTIYHEIPSSQQNEESLHKYGLNLLLRTH